MNMRIRKGNHSQSAVRLPHSSKEPSKNNRFNEEAEIIYSGYEDPGYQTEDAFHYLNCPRCQNKRLQDVVTSESRLKQCHHCQGVWFKLNELEKVIGNGAKFTWTQDTASREINTTQKPSCPICQTRLIQIRTLEISDLVVWACSVCQGRWVDGAQIVKLQKRGFFSSIKEFVMRLF